MTSADISVTDSAELEFWGWLDRSARESPGSSSEKTRGKTVGGGDGRRAGQLMSPWRRTARRSAYHGAALKTALRAVLTCALWMFSASGPHAQAGTPSS